MSRCVHDLPCYCHSGVRKVSEEEEANPYDYTDWINEVISDGAFRRKLKLHLTPYIPSLLVKLSETSNVSIAVTRFQQLLKFGDPDVILLINDI